MTLMIGAEVVAQEAMRTVNNSLTNKFTSLICCLINKPSLVVNSRSAKINTGSREYIYKLAEAFSSSRGVRVPTPPSTIPDHMVSVILNSFFNVHESKIDLAKELHALSMGAENIVGDLLERYIAHILEPMGWIWCSGSTVKAVDFIRPPTPKNPEWRLLQIKNRDNSENSSSSAVRNGTSIEKWHRTFSRTGETNWPAFPDMHARTVLSEQGFILFVQDYLARLQAR